MGTRQEFYEWVERENDRGEVVREYVVTHAIDDRVFSEEQDQILRDLDRNEAEMLAATDLDAKRIAEGGAVRGAGLTSGARGTAAKVRAERAAIRAAVDAVREPIAAATTLAELDAVDWASPLETLKRTYDFGTRSLRLGDLVHEDGRRRSEVRRVGREPKSPERPEPR